MIRAEVCLELDIPTYRLFLYCDLFCWYVALFAGPIVYGIGFGPLAIGWKLRN